MQVKRSGDTYLIRLDRDEDVLENLRLFTDTYHIEFGVLQAIGTLECVTLGYYDAETKAYRNTAVEEMVEILNMSGNIAHTTEGEPIVHVHITVGRSDYSAWGGHLVAARAGPTVEIVVERLPAIIRRRHDASTGLELWDLSATESLSA